MQGPMKLWLMGFPKIVLSVSVGTPYSSVDAMIVTDAESLDVESTRSPVSLTEHVDLRFLRVYQSRCD